eukprot:TRINITY_DN950_c0_g1_i1.p1 TRINITY_DN950_c0_g1~~TRINITY_DN950_c0_g1_i1.p1  ORF type:complete len:470 (-),score=208.24 TRINITY_DN950_c0_g1_i1:27-1436(-)
MFKLHKTILKNSNLKRFFSSKKSINNYDAIIVGAGMVGSTLATLLGKSPLTKELKIGLIENSKEPLRVSQGFLSNKYSDLPQMRVSAINQSTISLFEFVDIWSKLLETNRIKPFKQMKVWDWTDIGGIDFVNNEGLGYIIENDLISSLLNERIDDFKNITKFYGDSLEEIENINENQESNNQSNWIKIKTKNGNEFTTRLLIGADGVNSLIRKKMKVGAFGVTYNQCGLVCTVELANENNIAWQRFLSTGPLALLPLFDNYSSIVWSTTPIHAEKLLALSNNRFIDELNKSFQNSFQTDSIIVKFAQNLLPFTQAKVSPPIILDVKSKRLTFPLKLNHCTSYIDKRTVLIGDAAHSIHPLAGQGVNLGFADCISLATSISTAVECGEDIGSIQTLERYEKDRLAANAIMLSGVHLLQRLFNNNFSPIILARNIGLNTANTLSLIKEQLIQQAQGDSLNYENLNLLKRNI